MAEYCSKCQTNPPSHRNGYCTPCNRAYGRANYQANKDRYKAKAEERNRVLDQMLWDIKSVPCTDCGIEYPPYVMDFDHRDPDEKTMDVSKMRKRRMSFDTIRAEVAKCDVVCANCHRIRTNAEGSRWRARSKMSLPPLADI